MKRKTALSLGMVAAIAVSGVFATPVLASGDHGAKSERKEHSGGQGGMMGGGQGSGMMGGGQGGMMGGGKGGDHDMRQMMKMHKQMMSGGMGGMMGGGQDGKMGGMSFIKGMDTDGDGKISPDEARAALTAQLKKFDADGDGNLSISEFEALHSAAIRESMVGRFQMLDNDGDGKVTAEEMTAPAERMQKMMKKRAAKMMKQGENMKNAPGQKMPMDMENGTKKQDN